MNSTTPKCGHTSLDLTCNHCKALQTKYYAKLAKEGFKDIEDGLDNPSLLYQPVNLKAINPQTTAYYDAIWQIYHAWVKEGRSERDCTVAELLAKQDGHTGTSRGIRDFLKSKGLKPSSKRMVDRTLREIYALIPSYL